MRVPLPRSGWKRQKDGVARSEENKDLELDNVLVCKVPLALVFMVVAAVMVSEMSFPVKL